MAQKKAAKRTQKSYKTNAKNLKKGRFSPLLAGFVGAAMAIPLMLAVMIPMLHQEFQAQAASLNHRLVSLTPANAVLSASSPECVAPSGGAGAAGNVKPAVEITGASTPSHTTPPVGGKGGGPIAPSGPTNVITRMISYKTENNGKIENTGADSKNVIVAKTTNTTKIDNDNNVTLKNNNPQTAISGDVNSSQNTTAAGATSGAAKNSSDAKFVVKIDN